MAALRTLVVGHVTHDRFPSGLRAGGALYCARVHAALGARTRLQTAVGRDFACAQELMGLDWQGVTGEHTTSFTNLYPEVGPRVQRIDAIAPPIQPPTSDGSSWDVLHLAPVIGELDLQAWKARLRARVVGANLQGWLRAPGPPQRAARSSRDVRPLRWDPGAELLAGIDVACLSEEDLEGQVGLLERLVRAVPLVALTRGADGCDLYRSGSPVHVAAVATRCVDPTGAGDAFAAALLHGVASGRDPLDAARCAAAAAAIVIGAEATSACALVSSLRHDGP